MRYRKGPYAAIALMSLLFWAGTAVAQDKAPPAAPSATPVAPAAAIDTLKRIRETGTITLGVRETSVPFSFLDAQKQPQGYSIDLCLRVAETIKAELKLPRLEVKFLPVSSANRIPALLEGKIDLECGSTTNTRDRQKQVAFAYTTFVAGIKMLAKKSSNIASIEDLRGKSVVVTTGTTSEKMVRAMNDERLLKINVIESKDHGESFKAVDEGRAIAFPMDDVLLYGLISKSKKPDDFAVVGKYLSVEPYAIMMRRDEPQFEKIVNRALIDLFQSGEIRRIYAKWFNTRDLTVPLNQYLKEAFAAPNTYPAWP
ncbi:MAG TPA: amino acid ABC transporter substrate-binding protein [Casimicrobiaceae bacterium]|nr:amino acid ABC transporter substrate-binding protein [Casimicrobiaceae bacterium]